MRRRGHAHPDLSAVEGELLVEAARLVRPSGGEAGDQRVDDRRHGCLLCPDERVRHAPHSDRVVPLVIDEMHRDRAVELALTHVHLRARLNHRPPERKGARRREDGHIVGHGQVLVRAHRDIGHHDAQRLGDRDVVLRQSRHDDAHDTVRITVHVLVGERRGHHLEPAVKLRLDRYDAREQRTCRIRVGADGGRPAIPVQHEGQRRGLLERPAIGARVVLDRVLTPMAKGDHVPICGGRGWLHAQQRLDLRRVARAHKLRRERELHNLDLEDVVIGYRRQLKAQGALVEQAH